LIVPKARIAANGDYSLSGDGRDGESVYPFGEIREFEGKPRIRTSEQKKTATASDEELRSQVTPRVHQFIRDI
jgi:hypothetical protein